MKTLDGKTLNRFDEGKRRRWLDVFKNIIDFEESSGRGSSRMDGLTGTIKLSGYIEYSE